MSRCHGPPRRASLAKLTADSAHVVNDEGEKVFVSRDESTLQPSRRAQRGTAKSPSTSYKISLPTTVPLYPVFRRIFCRTFAVPYSFWRCILQQQRMSEERARRSTSGQLTFPLVLICKGGRREVRLSTVSRCRLRQRTAALAPTSTATPTLLQFMACRASQNSARAALRSLSEWAWQLCCKPLSHILDCTAPEAVI